MEKAILYLVLLALVLCWTVLYEGFPGLQGLLTIITICAVAAGCRCPRPREGR